MPEPQWHVAASPAAYGLARVLGARLRPVLTAAASVLVDGDHFVDMAYYRATGNRHAQIVPLHSWELAAALLCTRSRVARSVGLGLVVHYALDVSIGHYSVRQISLIYRARHRFRTGYLGDWVLWPSGSRGWRELFYSDVLIGRK